MTLEFRFTRRRRLRLRRDFQRVFACRCSTADGRLVVYVAANGLADSRLGLSVGKRVGNAVARHRIKRLIREAFRLSRHELPAGADIVCVARPASGTVDEYGESLRRLTATAWRKLQSRTR